MEADEVGGQFRGKACAETSPSYRIKGATYLEDCRSTVIAIILSDMDAELAAVEARLAKTRALKESKWRSCRPGRPS